MKKFESNVQFIKYEVNKEISRRFLMGKTNLEDELDDIAETIIPGPKPITRCCIYKERAIIKDRTKFAISPLKTENVINVLSIACDECPVDRFVVTEACRGCLAHKCYENCPKDAIILLNHRAYIDQNKCIECGRCKAVCPFNAISEVQRPCIRSCSANALYIGEDKKAYIDDEKCVSCGACVHQCPFGAIVDKPFTYDVLKLLRDSENNKNYKVYAVVAPAISSQFAYAKLGQVITGIKKLGFYSVVEAALGADIVALHEAHEFAETIEERQWMTSSCCPAFVSYMKKTYPEFMNHVSSTVSPMIAAAQVILQKDKDAKIVFIGPCTAKKMEIKEDDLKGIIDYVITFEELQAMIDAYDIELEKCEESELDDASYFGRIFAKSGGVAAAVSQAISEKNIDAKFEPIRCDGLDECVKNLKVASFNKLKANFIEGMACKGGCIGGAASLFYGAKSVTDVDKYGKSAKAQTLGDSTNSIDIDKLDLERKRD